MSPQNFWASSYRFSYLIFLIVYIQKIGLGHGVQFSRLHHSMVNVKIYKCLPQICALALTVSEISKNTFWHQKSWSRSRRAIFVIAPFNGKCENLQMSAISFWASSYRLRDIIFVNVWPPNVRQDHGMQFAQFHHSMANVKVDKRHFCAFEMFAKAWPERNNFIRFLQTETHINTRRNGQVHDYKRNLAVLPKNIIDQICIIQFSVTVRVAELYNSSECSYWRILQLICRHRCQKISTTSSFCKKTCEF